jgi:hypothetical protein
MDLTDASSLCASIGVEKCGDAVEGDMFLGGGNMKGVNQARIQVTETRYVFCRSTDRRKVGFRSPAVHRRYHNRVCFDSRST